MGNDCKRYMDCKLDQSLRCDGCSFKYFDEIFGHHEGNELLRFLWKEFFEHVQETRKSKGGRVGLDKPLRRLLEDKLEKSSTVPPSELEGRIKIGQDPQVKFKVKCDIALKVNKQYVLFEVKGAGDNTNDILSAITAAQCAKMIPGFENSLYYYIGVTTASKYQRSGITRKYFLDENRKGISPYAKWAEDRRFLKFFGIVEIKEVLKDIRELCDKR